MVKEKLMITGGASFLAVNMAYYLKDKYEIFLVNRSKEVLLEGVRNDVISLEDEASLNRFFKKVRPQYLVHTAGLTSVDIAEDDLTRALIDNVKTAEVVANVCKTNQVKMILVSTDHFSPEAEFSKEEDDSYPINNYARTKFQSEKVIREIVQNCLILRTNFFGQGHNFKISFSDRILNKVRNNEEIKLASDVYITPIWVKEFARVLKLLIVQDASGVYNLVGDERISKTEFAKKLLNTYGLDFNFVKEVKQDDFKRAAPRPRDMSLSNQKIKKEFNLNFLSLEDSFKEMLSEEKSGVADTIKNSVKLLADH